jgi:hypothetical protein
MPEFKELGGLAIAYTVAALKTGTQMVWVHRPTPTKEC